MEQAPKKITQYSPVQSLGQQSLEIIDGKLELRWKNIFYSGVKKINLKDVNPDYDIVYGAFDNWMSPFWFFIGAFITLTWFSLEIGTLITLTIAIILLLLCFKKYEWIYFRDMNRTTCFFIRYSGNYSEREFLKSFVANIAKEIKETQNH